MRRNITFRALLKQDYLYDYDNNRYKSRVIGNKEWIDRNYKTTHYADGTPIENVPDLLATNLLTGWTNANFNVFESSGSEIISASHGNITNGQIYTNMISLIAGDVLIFDINLMLLSGTLPHIILANLWDIVERRTLVDGPNRLVFNITSDLTLAYIVIENQSHYTIFSSPTTGLYKTIDEGFEENSDGAYCWFDNIYANKFPYGALYNYPAIENSHGFVYLKRNGIVEEGWRVPTIDDWDDLIGEIGESDTAGRLKETGTIHWESPNIGAENSNRMKIVGTGLRMETLDFLFFKINSPFWTTTPYPTSPEEWRMVKKWVNNNQAIFEEAYNKNSGLPVRLVRDALIPVFGSPVALPATDITYESFFANWESTIDAIGYYLDVSTSPTFTNFLPGFEDLDVSNVLTYEITGLDPNTTYYYRLRAYSIDLTSGNSNKITVNTEIVYTCCTTNQPDLVSHSVDHSMFLSAGLLDLVTGTIGDYAIDWREGSTSGTIVFTSGITADPGEVQVQHPFTDEVIFAGTLYPVIKYIYINGIKYTSEFESGSRYSPDLIGCLDPIIIDAIECDTIYGTDTTELYPYYLTYTNGVDLAINKSRSLKYNICGPGMKYLAVEFLAYEVADQLKIYYCTALDHIGVLLDNYIAGNRDSSGNPLTPNLYPSNYPTNPRIALYGQTGTSPAVFITDISSYTYVSGDYLRVEIIGAIYEPSNTNTNWYIKLKSLDELVQTFIATPDLYKIDSVPAISYIGDPDCRYEISYDTVESGITAYRWTPGVPDMFKYLWFWQTWYGNAAGYSMANPVKLGMQWKYTGSNYGEYTSPNWNIKENLDAGEQISLDKSGNDYIFTFTDVDDYNAMKSQIAAWKASASYITWSGLTDTDSKYYAWLMMYFTIAENIGDNSGGSYVFQFFAGDVIVEDDVNKKITWTCQVPTNNFPDPGSCNSLDAIVAQSIASMVGTRDSIDYSIHTHIRYKGWFYFSWPDAYNDTVSSREFFNAWVIEDAFVNGLIDMETLGFLKSIYPGYPNAWVLPHYADKITFTLSDTHAHRLANWKHERKIFLRTDDPEDTAYEIVHEEP
jgi:uncharacterized protein (TIGR02145 family)